MCRISRLPGARADAQITFLSVAVCVWYVGTRAPHCRHWTFSCLLRCTIVALHPCRSGKPPAGEQGEAQEPERHAQATQLCSILLPPSPGSQLVVWTSLDLGSPWLSPLTFWLQMPNLKRWAGREAPRPQPCSPGKGMISPISGPHLDRCSCYAHFLDEETEAKGLHQGHPVGTTSIAVQSFGPCPKGMENGGGVE